MINSEIAAPTHAGSGKRYLRQPAVLARVGVSWMTLRRWESAGIFPKRRKLGKHAVGWLESEIDEWCASRAIASTGAAA